MLDPRPHQIEALEALREIAPSGRAIAVMACGTGKTLVGRLAALEQAGVNGLIMLLVPSKELLRQTYEDWQRDVPGGVDGRTLDDGRTIDLGSDLNSAALKALKRRVRARIKEQ